MFTLDLTYFTCETGSVHRRTKGTGVKASLKALTVVVGACTVGGMLTGFAPLDSEAARAAAAVAAIQDVSPETLAQAGEVVQATSMSVAAQSRTDGVPITVPAEASDGVTVGSGENLLRIGLPYSGQASDATTSQLAGVVVFDNRNGSFTVPVIGDDGSVKINTVIENASAPRSYRYPIELPGGANLTLNDNGSVSAANADGSYEAEIAAPWAKDANGNAVATRYEVDGSVVTQIVDCDSATAFPVVADPSVITTTYIYSRADVERMWNTYQTMGTICNLIPGLSYMASLLCPGSARLREVLDTAHHQKKRVKATFYNCGFTYCNTYEYKVIS